MTLSAFNHLPALEAGGLMHGVCPSRRWAERVTASRPYHNLNELLYTAHRAWWGLGADEWKLVFGSVSSLRDRLLQRQAGAGDSTELDLDPIFAAEHQYRQKFGFGFVTYLGEVPTTELLSHCRQRLANDPDVELRTTAEEQARINRIQLEAIFVPRRRMEDPSTS